MVLVKKIKVFMLVLLLSIVITFPVAIMAQVTFERTYEGPDSYVCYSVEQTSDGGYLAAGYINHIATGNHDVYLMKTNAYGDTLWTNSYDKQPIDLCFSMQLTSDGGCVMAGYTGVWPDYKVLLIKTDAVGDTLWTRAYTCGDTIGYFGNSVQQTSDGGYIITGYTSNPDYSNDIFLIKTNSSGDTLWTQIYDKNEYDVGNSVKQTPDGGYVIAGKTAFSWYSYVFLIKTDATGDTLWTKTYGDTESQEGKDIQLTSDGGYIISGNIVDEINYTKNVYLVKIDDLGQILWTQSYGDIYDDFGNSVQQTSDGGYVIAGNTVNYPAIDIYLVKTDIVGDTVWTRNYGCDNPEYGNSVQQTSDDGYIVAGYSNNQSTSYDEVYLLKTDENGMVLYPGWITGNVSLDGGSGNVEEAEVTAGNNTVNPDVNGDYTIEIAPGTYDVTASLDGYEPDTVFDIVVTAGVITTGIDLLLTYVPPILNPPQNLTYDLIDGNVNLSWDAPESKSTNFAKETKALLGYNAYHALEQGAFELLGYTTETTYTDVDPLMGLHHYYVTAVYDEGESVSTDTVDVLITGIKDNILNNIQVFPNPATNHVNIKSGIRIKMIKVYNFTGQIVANEQVNNILYRLNTSQFNTGIYFLRIETNDGALYKRIIIE